MGRMNQSQIFRPETYRRSSESAWNPRPIADQIIRKGGSGESHRSRTSESHENYPVMPEDAIVTVNLDGTPISVQMLA
jgi:hypothetical protein